MVRHLARLLGCALAVAFVGLPASAIAHGGGLNAEGCHNDRKRGGYHCHRGPNAGQAARPPGSAPHPVLAVPSGAVSSSDGRDAETRLRELQKLRDKGLITPTKYNAKRKAILDAL